MKILRPLAVVLVLGYLVLLGWLAYLDKGGPAHDDLQLPGLIPATLYLPGNERPFRQVFPAPAQQRPPAVVLVHGFLADRQIMSVLARRITENGYAVLAIDVHGHGQNRNPFGEDELNLNSTLTRDIAEAVNALRASTLVDASRIVVMGHSMGAGAALDYATLDPSLKGSVMISGGFRFSGRQNPRNALFIFAENDPDFIRSISQDIAARISGVPQVELGRQYGDFTKGDAVEAIRIAGVDHVRILYSDDAARTIVKWLDGAFGTARADPVKLADPRVTVVSVAFAMFMVLLIPLGRICGGIAGAWTERADGLLGWLGLLILAGALVAAMPLTTMQPAGFTALVVGAVQVSWLLAAGVIMIGTIALVRGPRWTLLRERIGFMPLAAAIAIGVIYLCQVAMSVTFHNLAFTPERFLAWILVSILLLPFWAGFEYLVRYGSVLASTIRGVIGRVIILVLMAAGASFGIIPEVVMLIVPILVLEFATFEIFAASAYSGSRNLALIVMVEAMWLGFTIAATNPITFMF